MSDKESTPMNGMQNLDSFAMPPKSQLLLMAKYSLAKASQISENAHTLKPTSESDYLQYTQPPFKDLDQIYIPPEDKSFYELDEKFSLHEGILESLHTKLGSPADLGLMKPKPYTLQPKVTTPLFDVEKPTLIQPPPTTSIKEGIGIFAKKIIELGEDSGPISDYIAPVRHIIDRRRRERKTFEEPDNVTVEEAVSRLETQRYVKRPPRLLQIAADTTRTNIIRHLVRDSPSGGDYTNIESYIRSTTEQEAVQDLVSFLEVVEEKLMGKTDHYNRNFSLLAADMIDNTTFIGEKERNEAVAAIAALWKKRLDADPEFQLCAFAGISGTHGHKSDAFMLDSILQHFTDDELELYQGRLVTDLKAITAPPEKTKIVLLDDWIISGSQMRSAIDRLNNVHLPGYGSSVEIQLITSTPDRIQDGFVGGYFHGWNGRSLKQAIPVRAYFMAHTPEYARNAMHDHFAFETGAHSSVDFNFESDIIGYMLNHLRNLHEKRFIYMPGATNIIREYRRGELTNIERLQRSWRTDKTEKDLAGQQSPHETVLL